MGADVLLFALSSSNTAKTHDMLHESCTICPSGRLACALSWRSQAAKPDDGRARRVADALVLLEDDRLRETAIEDDDDRDPDLLEGRVHHAAPDQEDPDLAPEVDPDPETAAHDPVPEIEEIIHPK